MPPARFSVKNIELQTCIFWSKNTTSNMYNLRHGSSTVEVKNTTQKMYFLALRTTNNAFRTT